MKKIVRNEVLSLEKYKATHANFRDQSIKTKEHRRVHLGNLFTFLFENRDTVIYQIQEMIRVENLTDERAIQHEIDTYNKILPEKNELSATLLIEIEDPVVRKVKLKELLGLEEHLFLTIGDAKVKAIFDDQQLDEDRISSVQFLHFPLGENNCGKFLERDQTEIFSTHPCYTYSTLLNPNQLTALKSDLKSS